MIDVDWKPDHSKLRQFAALWWVAWTAAALLVGLGVVGTAAAGDRLPWLLAGVGAVVGMAGLLRPPVVRPVYLVWMALAFPVGWVVSHLLLVILYYGVFSAVGLVMRMGGRDALRLKRPPASESLWVPRPGRRDPESYFRRF